MGDRADTLRQRVRRSRRLLEAARETDNDYEIDVYSAELEDLLRTAAVHGVHIEGTDVDDSGEADIDEVDGRGGTAGSETEPTPDA